MRNKLLEIVARWRHKMVNEALQKYPMALAFDDKRILLSKHEIKIID